MATEYYIVKPKTKQTFYLGKRISTFDGLSIWTYTHEPRFPEWECWEDVVFDFSQNDKYFLESWPDTKVGQIWDFCSKIYEFCNEPVYLDDDCSNNKEWEEWECIDVFDEVFNEPDELEKWSKLYHLIPEEFWVKNDDIICEYETVRTYLERQKEGSRK